MKILGIIPARGGSKGIPKKNIKELRGKPLIAHTIEEALNSKLDKIIVSTECSEIAKISQAFGAEVMKRPAHLATDTTPTRPVIENVIDNLAEIYDAVMTLQPTSPLRKSFHINEAIEIFKQSTDADSLVSVVQLPHNFMPEKLMDYKNGYLVGGALLKRRQETKALFARNGAAIYITKTNKIREYICGGKVLPYFMSKLDSFDIDDEDDWKIMEKLV